MEALLPSSLQLVVARAPEETRNLIGPLKLNSKLYPSFDGQIVNGPLVIDAEQQVSGPGSCRSMENHNFGIDKSEII